MIAHFKYCILGHMTCHFFGHCLIKLIMNMQNVSFVFLFAYHSNVVLLNINLSHTNHIIKYIKLLPLMSAHRIYQISRLRRTSMPHWYMCKCMDVYMYINGKTKTHPHLSPVNGRNNQLAPT